MTELEKTQETLERRNYFDQSLLDGSNQASLYLLVKCYNSKKGVSKTLNQPPDRQTKFYVKGPMGIGIKFIPNQTNVCFIGGTGILSIIDYIARLALYNCGEYDGQ